jgi:hypothetical protein
MRRRLIAVRDARDIDDAPLALVEAAPNLAAPGEVNALATDIEQQAAALGWRPRVVVVDTLARVAPGTDENSARDVGLLVANLDRLGRRLGALIVVVHHSGKAAENGLRGSSALLGAADAVWRVANANGARTVNVEKMKDGEDGLSWRFDLDVVGVGTDADGDPITTCLARFVGGESPTATARPPKATEPPSLRLFMAAVTEALGEHGSEMRPFGSEGPAVRAVRRTHVRDVFLARHAGEEPEARRRAFNRAASSAAERSLIVARDVHGENFLWTPHQSTGRDK